MKLTVKCADSPRSVDIDVNKLLLAKSKRFCLVIRVKKMFACSFCLVYALTVLSLLGPCFHSPGVCPAGNVNGSRVEQQRHIIQGSEPQ